MVNHTSGEVVIRVQSEARVDAVAGLLPGRAGGTEEAIFRAAKLQYAVCST
jgi:hypothetical protein